MTSPARDRRLALARSRLTLLLITDRTACRGGLGAAVRRAIAGGVTAVMLREKDLPRDEHLHLGRDVADACRAAGALFVVNHDIEAAVRLAADGVHLGFRSTGVAEARAMLGEDALVGRSTHSAEELGHAILEGADYVTFGPVYDTPSKLGLVATTGVDALRAAVLQAGPVPVVALGGVTASRVPELRAAGVAGVACVREILAPSDAVDETSSARALRRQWESAR